MYLLQFLMVVDLPNLGHELIASSREPEFQDCLDVLKPALTETAFHPDFLKCVDERHAFLLLVPCYLLVELDFQIAGKFHQPVDYSEQLPHFPGIPASLQGSGRIPIRIGENGG